MAVGSHYSTLSEQPNLKWTILLKQLLGCLPLTLGIPVKSIGTNTRSPVLASKAFSLCLFKNKHAKAQETFLYQPHTKPVACIIKKITIVNDTSGIVRSKTVSCGVTYDCHSDDSRGVIYIPREHL
jgi:hypothetical protein